MDIDESSNKIRIGFEDTTFAASLREQIDQLNIPKKAILIEKSRPLAHDIIEEDMRITPGGGGGGGGTQKTLESHVRPLVGGLKISRTVGNTIRRCTLGLNVEWGIDDKGFVTASHCSADKFATDNTTFYQPEEGYGSIGTELHDPEPYDPGPDRYCPYGYTCRYSDATLVKYKPSAANDAATGYIARTSNVGSKRIDRAKGFSISESVSWPGPGHDIIMMGAETGWAQGETTSSCIDVESPGTNVLLVCVAEGEYESAGGDSGAPIFDRDGEASRFFGFHIGDIGDGRKVYSTFYYTIGENRPGSSPQCQYAGDYNQYINSELCGGARGTGPFEYRAPVFQTF